MTQAIYAKCHYTECCYAECCSAYFYACFNAPLAKLAYVTLATYAKCHYAECHLLSVVAPISTPVSTHL